MGNPQTIAAAINETVNISAKCENCGYRPKYRDKSWCKRCIEVWRRRRELNDLKAERVICNIVEPLYYEAKMSNLPEDLQEKLNKLEPGQDVFFYGSIGTGKTYAMAALIRKYVYEGYECARINFDDFCVKVRSAMAPASKLTEWDMIEPMKNIDKLFIDDLGLRSKQETDFAYVTFYSLINKRQERMLPTFVSSNKDINRLTDAFDSRIASRLSTALIIEMTGKDRRKNKNQNNKKRNTTKSQKGGDT
jgi:DNA replication protein DnaC